MKTLAESIKGYELSLDRKKLLIHKGDSFHIIDADAAPGVKLEKVSLGDWTFAINPRQEWRQMFTEAWRLERDYFYDRNMHGVDWAAMLKKYLPLVDRVTDRGELSDLIAEMVGELSALHIFVCGGDEREAPDKIGPGRWARGWCATRPPAATASRHLYRGDPDYPERAHRWPGPAWTSTRGCVGDDQRHARPIPARILGRAAKPGAPAGPAARQARPGGKPRRGRRETHAAAGRGRPALR